MVAGVTAGTAESVLVVTPAEALKTRMIEANKRGAEFTKPGTARMVKEIIEKDGIGAFWRGTAPVVGKQAVNSTVRFTTFGVLQGQVAKRWPEAAGKMSTTLAMGTLSGIVTAYVAKLLFSLSEHHELPADGIGTARCHSITSKPAFRVLATRILVCLIVLQIWRGERESRPFGEAQHHV